MVRSLDVQQIFLQSNAVERVQQVQQQQADVQQNHFQGQLAEEKRALREKVKGLEEAEQLMIKEEEERDKREKKKKMDKRKKEGADNAAADDGDDAGDLSVDEPVGKIDIRV